MPDDNKPGVKAAKKAWKTRRARRSTKGALIKGMSRRLPSEILEAISKTPQEDYDARQV